MERVMPMTINIEPADGDLEHFTRERSCPQAALKA
jgi:hypothetical protein